MEIEEKYDLMKRDLDKSVNEVDKLGEICCRLERENSEYYYENTKLKELLKECKHIMSIEKDFASCHFEKDKLCKLLAKINQALGEEEC